MSIGAPRGAPYELEVTTGSGATATPSPTATFTLTPTSAAPNGSAEYFYDGDGNLVKSIIGDITTYYPSSNYEKRVEGATETVLKYYFAGSVRIAMRENGVITWLLSDHLGSTSVTADGAGTLLTSLKYTAYGEIRTGSSLTDYQYTGQRNEAEIGLYYYVARFYDPQLARFISADTIVPEPGSVKAYDRFAYVNGNPINYNDPSGHMAWLGEGGGSLAQAEYDKQRNEQLYCQVGYKTYCSYAQNHPIETAAFTIGGVAAAGLVGGALGDVTVGTIIKVGGSATSILETINIACGGDCSDEQRLVQQTAQSVWKLNPFIRGMEIENILGRSPQLTQNYPVIDKFYNGVATSIKSIDLAAKTYQNIPRLINTVQGYANKLANWNGAKWGGYSIESDQILSRVLQLAIPNNSPIIQYQTLQQMQQILMDKGIELIITSIY